MSFREEQNDSQFSPKPKCLPDNRQRALAELHINPTHKNRLDESPAFLLYLNYAMNNIIDIIQFLDDKDTITEKNIRQKLNGNKGAISKLANFFWLFNEEDAERDFPDFEEKTLALAEKIFQLRNYFAHLNESGVKPLTFDRKMYEFLVGVLSNKALEASIKPGLRTAKLFKMKLAAVRDRNAEKKEAETYEFTRRGLVFIICLALYRDEAWEFTQCLEDMKLPACPKGNDTDLDCPCDCDNIAACKPGVAKAFVSMFTYYSARRGRSVNLLSDDLNYMSFADITGYLNKVPEAAFCYLALENETRALNALAEKSEELEENKEYKYSLHKRARDRFLAFAAAFCEDFDILKSLKFKRLDIPMIGEEMPEGRKRYFFGKAHDNRIHMDRHYVIANGAIRFAWDARVHYGDIHIDSLRSTISASAMKELLFAHFQGESIDKAVSTYFRAYHHILETILNVDDPNELGNQDHSSLLQDFATVSGLDVSAFENDLSVLCDQYHFLPKNLMRFFKGEDLQPSNEELRNSLLNELENRIEHASDFLTRLKIFNQWKQELGALREKDPEAKLPMPVCNKQDVNHPPRTCRISDGTLIAWVFHFFNLFLSDEQKFRQIPLGEQHRGQVDYEYQTVHKLIGKYSLDPKGLSNHIEKHKPELLSALEKLNGRVRTLQDEETKRRPQKLNRRGKPIKAAPSLSMLAEAAANCYIEYCNEKKKVWECNLTPNTEKLHKACRKFGVKTGMPLDRNSLLKTMLHLDLASWLNAFDQENNQNYETRSLDQEGHIISQIPFPNDFAQRIMLKSANAEMQQFIKQKKDGAPFFDFNAAFQAFTTEIALRDFYNDTPLILALYAQKNNGSLKEIKGLNPELFAQDSVADVSRAGFRRAIRIINETRNQDRILLKIANQYWQSFQSSGAFVCSKKQQGTALQLETPPSIYEYFDASVLLKFNEEGDERTICIMPNDVNKPILSQIHKYASIIAGKMDPAGTQSNFPFYEMLKEYRIIQAQDSAARLAIIPYISAFDTSVKIRQDEYRKGDADYNHNMEFAHYSQKFPALTREEYEKIVSVRNPVFHNGLGLKGVDEVIAILKKYVQLESRTPGGRDKSGKNWNHGNNRRPGAQRKHGKNRW